MNPRHRFGPALYGLVLFACGAVAASAAAGQADIPSSPTRWVTDTAGFLSRATVSSLDARLEEFERRTGHQVIVYIGRTTGDRPLEEWAVRAFEAWKVGRKGIDDGLVLFLMAEDRKVRIEVGYGLEPVVTDLASSRIVRDVLIPRLQGGDNDGAVTEAVTALLTTISGETSGQEVPASAGPRRISAGNKILAIIGVIFFIILFITNPRLAFWLLFSMMSGGRGGGGGGGGFRGGGGRSGGGGASGSW